MYLRTICTVALIGILAYVVCYAAVTAYATCLNIQQGLNYAAVGASYLGIISLVFQVGQFVHAGLELFPHYSPTVNGLLSLVAAVQPQPLPLAIIPSPGTLGSMVDYHFLSAATATGMSVFGGLYKK